MKKTIIIIIFIWIGFVGAISFMESWLKFQAPNITTELGLGIGKLVFKALNIVELVFFASIATLSLFFHKKYSSPIPYSFFIISAIVLLQTFWLLPALNERAELIIQGEALPKSSLHFLYVLLEILKVSSLFFFGIKLLKSEKIKY